MSDKPLPQFLQARARSNHSQVEQWHSHTRASADLGSVGVREVGVSFQLLRALLAGLLL